MYTLSTGDPSTLGSYLKLATAVFGDDSAAVTYLNKQIAKHPKGEEEPVIAAESQMVNLLAQIHIRGGEHE